MHLLGGGAIGLLHAYYLHQAGIECIVISRKKWGKHIVKFSGLTQGQCTLDYTTAQQVGPIRNLIVCTKAYDTLEAMEPLWPRLHQSRILLLQNGVLGLIDALPRPFHYWCGSTTHGVTQVDRIEPVGCSSSSSIVQSTGDVDAKNTLDVFENAPESRTRLNCLQSNLPDGNHFRLNPNEQLLEPNHQGVLHYNHVGQGITLMGNLSGLQNQWLNLLSQAWAPLNAKVVDANELSKQLWLKLAINACLNPLTVLLNCKNGGLDDLIGKDIIHLLCQEIAQVFPEWSMTSEYLFEQVIKVCQATRLNQNSMHKDIAMGRKTEIEFITGYILRQAIQKGISIPNHQLIYQLIRQKQKQNLLYKL